VNDKFGLAIECKRIISRSITGGLISYKIITVTNYKNFCTARKISQRGLNFPFDWDRYWNFSVLYKWNKLPFKFPFSHFMSHVFTIISVRGHLKTWRKILCQARPSFKLLTWTQQQHWILFLCIFVIFWCEPLVQFQSSVTPKSSSLPLTNTEREI
jgi:hypothetical protein